MKTGRELGGRDRAADATYNSSIDEDTRRPARARRAAPASAFGDDPTNTTS